jgi:hypothetical protein
MIASLTALAPGVGALAGEVPWGAALVGFVLWIGHFYFQSYLHHVEVMARLRAEAVPAAHND